MNRINLYCLPFAGGSKYSYKDYVSAAPDFINVVPIELPGRGSRYKEPLLTDAAGMVDDVYGQIKDMLGTPYAIYGHSMGAVLGYLLARRILEEGMNPPEHLFLTGCRGPSVQRKDPLRHLLSKEEFIQELKNLGGCPDEILNDDDLMNFFEPILRADFQAVETLDYRPQEPIHIPINVMTGISERTTYQEAMEWQKETTAKVEGHRFPGKHFFIFNYPKEILEIIARKLTLKILQ